MANPTPTVNMLYEVEKDMALLLSIQSYGSVRRGVIRRAIEYANSFPPAHMFVGLDNVSFRGMAFWNAATNLGASVTSNDPVREAFRLIGGGAERLVLEAEKSFRLTGGRGSLARVLLSYAGIRSGEIATPQHDQVAVCAEELFQLKHRGRLTLLRPDELDEQYKMMTDTSSGYYFQRFIRLAPKRLGYVMRHARELNRIARTLSRIRLEPHQQILIPWFMASRGKMNSVAELEEKIRDEKPLSRGIMVGEPSEHYLFYPLYKPLFRRITSMVCDRQERPGIIKIGIRKNSNDWSLLWSHLKRWDYVMTSDWSSFDSSLRPELLRFAWEVMVYAFEVRDDSDRNYLINLSNIFNNNFIDGVVSHAGLILNKRGGLPSGSILTSILGSIVNFYVLKTLLKEHAYVDDAEIFVYGDDAIIGIKTKSQLCRKEVKRSFLHQLGLLAEKNFKMKLSLKKTEIAPAAENFFRLVQPCYAEDKSVLLQGTSCLKPLFFRDVDDFRFEADYDTGYTHRAQYKTKSAVHFLGKSFDRWGRPIMSTLDTVERMVNPENGVVNIVDAKRRVIEYACDNVHNRLLINQLKYVYLALAAMEDELGSAFTRWPRSLSQKMRASPEESAVRCGMLVNDNIVALPDGALRLRFRGSAGYVNLREDPFFSKYVTEFEVELRRRTGWEDVYTDWELLNAYGRRQRMWNRPLPSRVAGWTSAPASSGPFNERVKDIGPAAEMAIKNELYGQEVGNLGGGGPDVIALDLEKLLSQEGDPEERGFITGCLLGMWPSVSRYREAVWRDVRELLAGRERIGWYAEELSEGRLRWEANAHIVFLSEKEEEDAVVARSFRDAGWANSYAKAEAPPSYSQSTRRIITERIMNICGEYRKNDTRRTWLFRRHRANCVYAYFAEMESMLLGVQNEELKEAIERRFLTLGPERPEQRLKTERIYYNNPVRESFRLTIARAQLEADLKVLRLLIKMGRGSADDPGWAMEGRKRKREGSMAREECGVRQKSRCVTPV